jgi:hypothetical protein
MAARTRRKPARRPASVSAHVRLQRLQRRIYLALEREAERLLGTPPASIRGYQRSAERDFSGRHRLSTKEELVAQIRRHDVTFIADFHTFAQAQRTALRLMREAVLPGERWALGLELIPSHCQRALDDFQARRIGTRKFHELIRYREEWGFPWKNYEPLFEWAREHQVRLIALNRPRELLYRGIADRGSERSGKDLHARDQWAAGIITDLIAEQPGLRMLVLYGGHHVGLRHLPAQLARVSRAFMGRPLTSLSVHQNHAALYWKLARREIELHAQVLKLQGGKAYAVFSATPWAQLQSLIGCAEGEDLEEIDEAEGIAAQGAGSDDPSSDYLSLMRAYGSVIAEFLGLPRESFVSLSLRTIEEADFVEAVGNERLSTGERRLANALIGANERFYLAREQIAYLASPSPNSAAEYASIHLLRRHSRNGAFFKGDREDFFRLALESAFGFLGSLILNPRRKCDLPRDHERRIAQLDRGARASFHGEREARKTAIGALSPRARDAALSKLPAQASARALPAWWAARAAGQILAKRLHPWLLRLKHGSPEFRSAVALLTRKRGFEAAFDELMAKKAERARHARPETSKRETL